MNPEPGQKKVDESWKEQVEKEKSAQPPPPPQPKRQEPPAAPAGRQPQQQQPQQPQRPRRGAPQSDFSMFLSSLSMQALVALGEVAHPVTGLAQPEPEQARYLIDVLGLLQEKTQGNLSPEETTLMDGLLYELRMKFVERTQGGPAR